MLCNNYDSTQNTSKNYAMGAHYDCCDQDWRTSHVIALFPGQVGNTGICRLFTGKNFRKRELDEGILKMIHDIV